MAVRLAGATETGAETGGFCVILYTASFLCLGDNGVGGEGTPAMGSCLMVGIPHVHVLDMEHQEDETFFYIKSLRSWG